MEEIIAALTGPGLQLHRSKASSAEVTYLLTVTMKHAGDQYFRRTEVGLARRTDGRLLVTAPLWNLPDGMPFTTVAEFTSVIAACREAVARRLTVEKKRAKVRDFKVEAIMARVRELAEELGFAIDTRTDTQKLTLCIDLGRGDTLQVFVPFNRFMEVLPQLRQTIQACQALQATGIPFKVTLLGRRDAAEQD